MKRVDVLSDLGIMRSWDGTFTEYCRNAVAKESKISDLIRYVFARDTGNFYDQLLLTSCYLFWATALRYGTYDSNATLLLLRAFRGNSVRKYLDLTTYPTVTGSISFMLSLWLIGWPSLILSRHLNTCTAYLTVSRAISGPPWPLYQLEAKVRKVFGSDGVYRNLFHRRPINTVAAKHFSHRAATTLNNLPFDCFKNNSLNIFKKKVLNQLYKQLCEIWIYFYHSKQMSAF